MVINQLHVVRPASLEAEDHAIQARHSDGVEARKVAHQRVRAVARRKIRERFRLVQLGQC